jgi:uncharacterized protein (TIGR00255 family)
MARSMTGFSRVNMQSKEGQMVGEISSLNKKYFEANLFLPPELFRYEMEIRKKIQEKIFRGQVLLRIAFHRLKPNLQSVLPDTAFLKALKKGWEERASILGLDKKSVNLLFLSQQIRGNSFLEIPKEDESAKKLLFTIVDQLLEKLILMKQQEGALLFKDMKKRLATIMKRIDSIEKISKGSVSLYREKLLQKVGEFFAQPQDKERILQEVVLFADKIDITEEIVRFRSHFHQMETLLKGKDLEACGRKLEFIVQEMHREINTIGSKNLQTDISQEVVEVKSELEKIREQVQNIE